MIKKILAIVMLIAAVAADAMELKGVVVGVVDGDTIEVLDENKTRHVIRLAGIDAPEKRQAYGWQSKKSLSDQIYLKAVSIDGKKNDRYGRLIGKVVRDGMDVNLVQVELGMAWVYRKYLGELHAADRSRYVEVEFAARTLRRGLWTEESPTPPWDFRKRGASADSGASR